MSKVNLRLSQSNTVSCLKGLTLERESGNPSWSDGKIAQVQSLLEIAKL